MQRQHTSNAPSRVTIDRHIIASESRLRDAKEIFEKAAREQGLKVYIQKETK